jgi:single-stranded DNA-binding protein
LSTASILTSIASKPGSITLADGTERVSVQTITKDEQKIQLTVVARPGSAVANSLLSQEEGALVLLTGEVTLDKDGNLPSLNLRSICKGYEDQFLNEVSVTGRLSGQIKAADKSDSSSLAVNRYEGGEQVTDWFRIRCFGANRDRLVEAPKGALVTASGILEMRESKEGKPYVEVKVRVLHMHARAGAHDAAEGREAAGYANSDFDGSDAPPIPTDWS